MPYRVEFPKDSDRNFVIKAPVSSGLSLLKSTGDCGDTGVADGRIIAVKICSQVLDACIWFSFDPEFKPAENEALAVFYDHELQFLRNKTVEQLKEIHQWKLAFGPGARVRQ